MVCMVILAKVELIQGLVLTIDLHVTFLYNKYTSMAFNCCFYELLHVLL